MADKLLARAFLTFTALLQFDVGPPALGQVNNDRGTGAGALAGTPGPTSTADRTRAADAIANLRSQLINANSATAVLDQWCASHGMAPAGAVVADKIDEGSGAELPAIRRLLHVGSNGPIGFRHVRLRCRDHLLSEAMLWYVPGRLPALINRQLRETDIPFGRAVAPLNFRRRPLPAIRSNCGVWNLPGSLFDQAALLVLPDGEPIAYVHEIYLPGVLDFPAP